MSQSHIDLSALKKEFHEHIDVNSGPIEKTSVEGYEDKKPLSDGEKPTSLTKLYEASSLQNEEEILEEKKKIEEKKESTAKKSSSPKISLGNIKGGTNVIQKDPAKEGKTKKVVSDTDTENPQKESQANESTKTSISLSSISSGKEVLKDSPKEELVKDEGSSKKKTPSTKEPKVVVKEQENADNTQGSHSSTSVEETKAITCNISQGKEEKDKKTNTVNNEDPQTASKSHDNNSSKTHDVNVEKSEENISTKNKASAKTGSVLKSYWSKNKKDEKNNTDKSKSENTETQKKDAKYIGKKEKVEFGNYQSSFERQSQKVKKKLKHFEYKRHSPLKTSATVVFCLTVIVGGMSIGWQRGYIPERYTANITRIYSESEGAQEIVENISKKAEVISEKARESSQNILSDFTKEELDPHKKLKNHLLNKDKSENSSHIDNSPDEERKEKLRQHLLKTYSG